MCPSAQTLSESGTYAGLMMKHKLLPIACALALVGALSVSPASAQTNLNQRTVLTFSQPIEVPGKVLPAGSYTFELHESQMNRHIVQVYDADGKKLITTFLAIPNRRLETTSDTVVRFAEVAAGQPQAMRAWFYPGQTVGQEMVYPRKRATELSASANVVVPAVDDTFYDTATMDTMKTVDVTSVSPDRTAATTTATSTAPVVTQPATPPATQPATQPVTPPAVDTTPRTQTAPVTATPATPEPVTAPEPRRELPSTASTLPLIALFGFVTLALGLALRGYSTGRSVR
jgi:hypothetical protein